MGGWLRPCSRGGGILVRKVLRAWRPPARNQASSIQASTPNRLVFGRSKAPWTSVSLGPKAVSYLEPLKRPPDVHTQRYPIAILSVLGQLDARAGAEDGWRNSVRFSTLIPSLAQAVQDRLVGRRGGSSKPRRCRHLGVQRGGKRGARCGGGRAGLPAHPGTRHGGRAPRPSYSIQGARAPEVTDPSRLSAAVVNPGAQDTQGAVHELIRSSPGGVLGSPHGRWISSRDPRFSPR